MVIELQTFVLMVAGTQHSQTYYILLSIEMLQSDPDIMMPQGQAGLRPAGPPYQWHLAPWALSKPLCMYVCVFVSCELHHVNYGGAMEVLMRGTCVYIMVNYYGTICHLICQ